MIRVIVVRGSVLEAEHVVHAAFVGDGSVDSAIGDIGRTTPLRSAAKPFFAAALVAERSDLGAAELAIASSSHAGDDESVDLVRSLLRSADASADDLRCSSDPRECLRHPCSGSHAGMLALAQARGWDSRGYTASDQPVQQQLLRAVHAAIGRAWSRSVTAVDGCGIPTLRVRLAEAATGYANLASEQTSAHSTVARAIRDHPTKLGPTHLPLRERQAPS
jgi:L-asparaginase